jgi:hypothetical protein
MYATQNLYQYGKRATHVLQNDANIPVEFVNSRE